MTCLWRDSLIAPIFFSRWGSTNGPFLTERAITIYPFSFARYIYRKIGVFSSCILWSACPTVSSGDFPSSVLRRRHADDLPDFSLCRASLVENPTSAFSLLCPRRHFLGRRYRLVRRSLG